MWVSHDRNVECIPSNMKLLSEGMDPDAFFEWKWMQKPQAEDRFPIAGGFVCVFPC